MDKIVIREIQRKDNQIIGEIIQSVLMELGAPKIGTAYSDPELFSLFESYQNPRSVYYVVENNGKVLGGGGIAPLQNGDEAVCELQKMYFLPEARGLGVGSRLMEICLESAKKFGFKQCYLETMPYMEAAQKLYKKSGFENVCAPMGNTGHTSCPVWMICQLDKN